jgi:hypothetical protein
MNDNEFLKMISILSRSYNVSTLKEKEFTKYKKREILLEKTKKEEFKTKSHQLLRMMQLIQRGL